MIAVLLIIIVGCLGVLFIMFGIDGLKKHFRKVSSTRKGTPDINKHLHPL